MMMVVSVQARRTARCAARQVTHSEQTKQVRFNQTRKENLLLVLTLWDAL